MPKYNRIESLDQFPLSQRLSMSVNLMTKELSVFYQGREATEIEQNTALWSYHQALYEAERQIEFLVKRIKNDEMEEYLEEYPDLNKSEEFQYYIEEAKECLFRAMQKNNASLISKYANKVNLLLEKQKEIQNKEATHDC
jgi:hypothetical protein